VGLVGSFWWKDVCKLLTTFRGITTMSRDGSSLLFWKDKWSDELLALKYPLLYLFALDSDVSLRSMLACEDLNRPDGKFAVPISVQALHELTDIDMKLQFLRDDSTSRTQFDTWRFFLQNGFYSSMAFFLFFFDPTGLARRFPLNKPPQEFLQVQKQKIKRT
jgi:hypothetical protein